MAATMNVYPCIEVHMVDGTSATYTHPRQLQALTGSVTSMVIKNLNLGTAPSARAFLQQAAMPRLTSLHIIYIPAPPPGRSDSFIFDLPHDKYPSLDSIALENAMVALTPPLASRLQSLIMGGTRMPGPRLRLEPFLACIPHFAQLEYLQLRNCFGAPGPIVRAAPGAIIPAPPLLRTVDIKDHPLAIREIMSDLDTLSDADVTLCGELRGLGITSPSQCGEAFLGMLGRYTENLPILEDVRRVDVTSTMANCDVVAWVSPEDEHEASLSLALRTDFCGNTDIVAVYSRAWLLSYMVEHLKDIIPPENWVTHLNVVGEAEAVESRIWRRVLKRFRHLTHLSVKDETRRRFPTNLLVGLVPGPTGGPICHDMQSLELCGGLKDEDELRVLCQCLDARHKVCGCEQDLEDLKIELYSDVAWEPRVVDKYRDLLERITGQRGLEVRVRQ